MSSWDPRGVCWNEEDELFVVNCAGGAEKGVHRFSSTGEYKGCVVHGLVNPCDLTIDNDMMLVAEGKIINKFVLK